MVYIIIIIMVIILGGWYTCSIVDSPHLVIELVYGLTDYHYSACV